MSSYPATGPTEKYNTAEKPPWPKRLTNFVRKHAVFGVYSLFNIKGSYGWLGTTVTAALAATPQIGLGMAATIGYGFVGTASTLAFTLAYKKFEKSFKLYFEARWGKAESAGKNAKSADPRAHLKQIEYHDPAGEYLPPKPIEIGQKPGFFKRRGRPVVPSGCPLHPNYTGGKGERG